MTDTAPTRTLDARQLSLVVVFLTVVIDLLGFGMVLPLLPVYGKELTAGLSGMTANLVLGLLMVCYSLLQLIFDPFWSRVSDYLGRRPILVLGLASTWHSLAWLFVARIVGGIMGGTVPTAQAYIADITPPEQRAHGMALIGAAFGLGLTFGPLLGAVALLAAGSSKLSPWPGYLAAGLSMTALGLALVWLKESLHHRASIRQARKHMNLRELREALRVPSIGMLMIAMFICVFGFAAVEGTLSLVLSFFLKVDKENYKILLAFACVGFVQTIVQGGLVRWMATFTSEGMLSMIGAVLSIVGYLALALAAVPQTGGTILVVVAASIVVSGLGFLYPSINALLSRRSDPDKQGGILGIGGALGTLGRIAGIPLALVLMRLGQPVPYWVSAGLMMAVLVLVTVALRAGRDFVVLEKAAAGV